MGTSENSRRLIKAVLCSFVLLAEPSSSVGPETLHFKWDVEYLFWSPDCVENIVMGINGTFPGPTIRAKAGDTIVIELTNRLFTEGVVIHWHSIRQFGTPWADGTASISQCAINPGETFTYQFKVDKPGTYFYHGHYGMQRSAGLYGSLIVDVEDGKKEPFQYDGEFTLLLSDWWHQSSHHQEVGLSSSPIRWIGEPQTLLLNGRGQYYNSNCSLAAHNSNFNSNSSECKQCASETLAVLPNKIYRLRIASTTALASLNLAIENHKMVVVEADGNYVEPFEAEDLDIYSGESYSVLMTTDQDPSNNYWVSVGVRGREPKTPPALTLVNYLPNSASKIPTSSPPVTPQWNDYNRSKALTNKFRSPMGSPQPPSKYDRRITLLNTQNRTMDGYVKWAINNVSLTLPPTPILGSIWYGLDIDTKSGLLYMLVMNATVDVILQNAIANGSVSEIHPWHLHGHDFWVLGYGEGEFSEGQDEEKFNLKNPPMKNTAVLYPQGWTALRFVADNPGAWAFHCHIEPHLHMGMGVVLAEGIEHLKSIPNEALACGLTAKLLMARNHT